MHQNRLILNQLAQRLEKVKLGLVSVYPNIFKKNVTLVIWLILPLVKKPQKKSTNDLVGSLPAFGFGSTDSKWLHPPERGPPSRHTLLLKSSNSVRHNILRGPR